MMSATRSTIALLSVMILVVTSGCSSAGGSKGDEVVGTDEGSAGAVTAALPIGSTLTATSNLNLRTSPSTSSSVLHVIPTGAEVVTVNTTTAQNGFYNVKHAGSVGWAYGSYLTLVQSGGGGDAGGGGGGGGGSSARDAAITRAAGGVGFSYWWGHGRWMPNASSGSNAGSCSGSCPSCSHSGGYGADCSGFAAKVWELPGSNSDPTVDSHPYATSSFVNESHGWHDVSRSAVQKGDALTYNSGGAGHIFIYESGDAWGSMWTYEAKGCSYGIVHDLRTASSAYKAIAHDGW
jgi:hypothetical protein